ncbi:MAG: DUF1059 domain-containing protein [Candidatus Methanoperedens sp.]|nr:DUF1059 domain-containing protein [Candidatus Methanoperedens sp.]
MVKEFECRSAGVDCPFMVRDENENELTSLAQQHVKNTHQKNMSRDDVLRTARDV